MKAYIVDLGGRYVAYDNPERTGMCLAQMRQLDKMTKLLTKRGYECVDAGTVKSFDSLAEEAGQKRADEHF